jgi:hypothetical protein
MVNFNYAFTALINPPNASPVLTVPQIWAGLQRKIRFAHEFVPVIESCEVISDENDVVTRVVKFKKGMGPGAEGAKEIVRGWEPSWVSAYPLLSSSQRVGIRDGIPNMRYRSISSKREEHTSATLFQRATRAST